MITTTPAIALRGIHKAFRFFTLQDVSLEQHQVVQKPEVCERKRAERRRRPGRRVREYRRAEVFASASGVTVLFGGFALRRLAQAR